MNEIAQVCVRLHEADNVVTVTRALETGVKVDGVTTLGLIPRGHKVATRKITKGEAVRKYAQIIGYASGDIEAGEHVHTHNVEFRNTAGALRILDRPAPCPGAGDARHLHGIPPRQRQGRHAQLHRHHHLGQLLRNRRRMIASAFGPEELAALSRMSTAWLPSSTALDAAWPVPAKVSKRCSG